MKVGPLEHKAPVAPAPDRAAAPAAKSATAGTAEPSAQVALSSTASLLAGAPGEAAGDFDTEKVERIAQAIRDGKFKVNPEAIADKLIANAKDVLGTSPH